jgi:predicted nucleic acid-binding protein
LLTDKGESIAQKHVTIMQNAEVVQLTPEIAMMAAKIGKAFKLPMADSIIYATAQIHNADVHTKDKHFLALSNVHYYGGEA